MRPIIEVGGVSIYAHGFFMFLGLLVGGLWLFYEARRRRWSKEEMISIGLAAFVGGMIGARISILFFNGWETAPIVPNLERHIPKGKGNFT